MALLVPCQIHSKVLCGVFNYKACLVPYPKKLELLCIEKKTIVQAKLVLKEIVLILGYHITYLVSF